VIFREHRSDSIIIVHSTAGLLLGIILTFLGVDVISVIHGRASNYTGHIVRMIEKLAVKYCHTTVFMNKQDFVGLRPKSARVVHNCLMKKFLPRARNELNVELKKVRAVIVARHSAQKNLSIIADVAKLNVSIPFYVYGDGPDFYKNRHKYKDIQNLFFQKEEKVENIYTDNTIFLLPTYSEGFPLSVMEAASGKLPLLLSDIPELKEIFSDNAQYFCNDDFKSLSSLIRTLVRDRHTFEYWSERSFRVTQIYTQERFLNSWKKIIEEPMSNA